MADTIMQEQILNKIDIINGYFINHLPKDCEKDAKIMFHPYRIDLSTFPDNLNRFIFLEHLLDLMGIIWSEKRFSRLISDLAILIAYTLAINAEYAYEDRSIDEDELNNMFSKFSYNCEIASKYLGYYKHDYLSMDSYSGGCQYIFKYSELSGFIDKLEILGVDTRRYFHYDGTKEYLGGLYRLMKIEGITKDMEIIEKTQNEKGAFFQKILNKNKSGTQTISNKEIQYFTIPLWRFFIVQFLTAGFYGLYWSYKNLKNIGDASGKKYSAGNLGISLFGPYQSILGHFFRFKPLVALISVLLNIILLIWPVVQIGILQNQKILPDWQEYEYVLGGIFTLPRFISITEKLAQEDPLKMVGLYTLGVGILCIFFFIISSPVIIAQYYAKKYHRSQGKNEFTAKFGVLEGIIYLIAVGVIYATLSGQWNGFSFSGKEINPTLDSSVDTSQNIVWNEYKSYTGSFIISTPGLIKYSRHKYNENNVEVIIDDYKASINSVVTLFRIIHAQSNNKSNRNGKSVLDMYKSFITSYQPLEEVEYNEINGEAHYIIKVELDNNFFYIRGRIIKNNNNEFFNIYSGYLDGENKELAEKFINSFKLMNK